MSPSAQTLKAPRQQNLPLPVRIHSAFSGRGIAASSLRPGDWIRFPIMSPRPIPVFESDFFVVQNSAKIGRVELESDDGNREVLEYDRIQEATYLGQGRRRWWWRLLPELARKYVSEFSRP